MHGYDIHPIPLDLGAHSTPPLQFHNSILIEACDLAAYALLSLPNIKEVDLVLSLGWESLWAAYSDRSNLIQQL